jgi:hypothetical protein
MCAVQRSKSPRVFMVPIVAALRVRDLSTVGYKSFGFGSGAPVHLRSLRHWFPRLAVFEVNK